MRKRKIDVKRNLNKKKRMILILAVVFAAAACFAIYITVEKTPDYNMLAGEWVRDAGGYILDIKNVHPDGKLDAVYLNPKSINVSKACVNTESGQMELFIELRDKYYPGSYYTLKYDLKKDILIGIYHHLGLRQNFDVIFSRKAGNI
jgi:hypothetical protein